MTLKSSAAVWQRFLLFFLFVSFLTGIICPMTALADNKTEPVIRVGWYESDMFQEGMSDTEEKSGFCYNYLQKVADHTNWHYEYVYGSWTDLFNMLLSGEIDLMGGVSSTPERETRLLFPNHAMGIDQYYLCKRASDDTIDPLNRATMEGKKVGTITGSRMTDFAQQWADSNQVTLELVSYDSFEAQAEAFWAGEVDFIAQTVTNVQRMQDLVYVTKLGEESFYMAVSQSRPDLLEQLNAAMRQMLSIDPLFLQDMYASSYGVSLVGHALTPAETQWIETHSVLRVGYLDNYLPYCDMTEDYQATGLFTDVLAAMLEALGIA